MNVPLGNLRAELSIPWNSSATRTLCPKRSSTSLVGLTVLRLLRSSLAICSGIAEKTSRWRSISTPGVAWSARPSSLLAGLGQLASRHAQSFKDPRRAGRPTTSSFAAAAGALPAPRNPRTAPSVSSIRRTVGTGSLRSITSSWSATGRTSPLACSVPDKGRSAASIPLHVAPLSYHLIMVRSLRPAKDRPVCIDGASVVS